MQKLVGGKMFTMYEYLQGIMVTTFTITGK